MIDWLKKGEELYVIDYKTGHRKSRDEEQVRAYKEALNCKSGIIYYSRDDEVVYV